MVPPSTLCDCDPPTQSPPSTSHRSGGPKPIAPLPIGLRSSPHRSSSDSISVVRLNLIDGPCTSFHRTSISLHFHRFPYDHCLHSCATLLPGLTASLPPPLGFIIGLFYCARHCRVVNSLHHSHCESETQRSHDSSGSVKQQRWIKWIKAS